MLTLAVPRHSFSPAHFDRDASRYHAGVYQRKRTDLVANLDSSLSPIFLGHIKNLHKSVVRDFKGELLDALKGKEYDFGDVVTKGRAKAEKTFVDGAEGEFKSTNPPFDGDGSDSDELS